MTMRASRIIPQWLVNEEKDREMCLAETASLTFLSLPPVLKPRFLRERRRITGSGSGAGWWGVDLFFLVDSV